MGSKVKGQRDHQQTSLDQSIVTCVTEIKLLCVHCSTPYAKPKVSQVPQKCFVLCFCCCSTHVVGEYKQISVFFTGWSINCTQGAPANTHTYTYNNTITYIDIHIGSLTPNIISPCKNCGRKSDQTSKRKEKKVYSSGSPGTP